MSSVALKNYNIGHCYCVTSLGTDYAFGGDNGVAITNKNFDL